MRSKSYMLVVAVAVCLLQAVCVECRCFCPRPCCDYSTSCPACCNCSSAPTGTSSVPEAAPSPTPMPVAAAEPQWPLRAPASIDANTASELQPIAAESIRDQEAEPLTKALP
jgi:hypothetical protein